MRERFFTPRLRVKSYAHLLFGPYLMFVKSACGPSQGTSPARRRKIVVKPQMLLRGAADQLESCAPLK